MPFIELVEHTEHPTVRPRRFLVNTDRISYIAALSETEHAVLIFDDRTRAIVVDESFEVVQSLVENLP